MGLFSRTKSSAPPVAEAAPPRRPASGGDHQVGASLVIHGELRFSGRLQFDGQIDGHLVAEPLAGSIVILGPNGRVNGRIEADTVVIAGQVRGPIRAHRQLEVRSGARIVGDLAYRDLQIQHGATVEGMLRSMDGAQVALKLVANSRT